VAFADAEASKRKAVVMKSDRYLMALVVVASLALCSAAAAEPSIAVPTQCAQGATHVVVGPAAPLADCAIVYSDTSNPSGYAYAGGVDVSVMDDLHMTSGGVLCSFDVGYYNNGAEPISATVSFYENDSVDTAVGSLLAGPFLLDALPAGAHIAHFEVVSNASFLTQDVWMAVSSPSADFKLLIYGPATVGTSDDLFYMDPPGEWYWFGGTPAADFCLQVECEPGSPVESSSWGAIKALYR
jgi:hypothetical protein